MTVKKCLKFKIYFHVDPVGQGGGTLSYLGYIGMRCCEGQGYKGIEIGTFWSRMGYNLQGNQSRL